MLYFAARARVVKVLLHRARHYAARGVARSTILIVFGSKQNTKK
jgi:hypothetical protein